jgi:hypothetical protein
MNSLTVPQHECMPGYHAARIVAAALTLPDAEQRAAVIASVQLLLARGDR